MANRECEKGYSCGASCISIEKECTQSVGAEGSKQISTYTHIAKKAKELSLPSYVEQTESSVTKGYNGQTVKSDIFSVSTTDGKKYELDIVAETWPIKDKNTGAAVQELIFTVDSTIDVDQAISRANKLRLAIATKSSILYTLRDKQDGALFVAEPYYEDGHGDSRRKFYEANGFKTHPVMDKYMFAKKAGNKLEPADFSFAEDVEAHYKKHGEWSPWEY